MRLVSSPSNAGLCFVLCLALLRYAGVAFCQQPSPDASKHLGDEYGPSQDASKHPGDESFLKKFLNFIESDPLRLQDSLPEDWTNWALVISEVISIVENSYLYATTTPSVNSVLAHLIVRCS